MSLLGVKYQLLKSKIMLKFKDLILLIPTVDVIDIWKKSGSSIVYKDTFKPYINMDLYGEYMIDEIRILGTTRIIMIIIGD